MKRIGAITVALLLSSLGLLVRPAAAATVTVNCATQSLQEKINHAPAGSTLAIKGTCAGNFTVNKDLTLKGSPTATLDGNDTGSTLTIPGSSTIHHTVHLIRLIVTGGMAATGAGINKAIGVLTLDHVTVVDNLAIAPNGAAGGGIRGGYGPTTIRHSSVVGNRAFASGSGSASAGGAGIHTFGLLTIVDSVVSHNAVTAKSSAGYAIVDGGAISTQGAPLTIVSSHIDDNHITGSGTGANGGDGGAIYDLSPGKPLSIRDSTFNGNSIKLSNGTGLADGGAIRAFGSIGTVVGTAFRDNQIHIQANSTQSEAHGGALDTFFSDRLSIKSSRLTGSKLSVSGPGYGTATGGAIRNSGRLSIVSSTLSSGTIDAEVSGVATAEGGAIHQEGSDPLSITRSTIDRNSLIATSSGSDVSVSGGGVESSARTTLVSSTLSRNVARGTATHAGTGPTVLGGGLHQSSGSLAIRNSTIAANRARAFATGFPTSADANGGGVYVGSGDPATFLHATVARNSVEASAAPAPFANGGGLDQDGGPMTVRATIVALNTASGGGAANCFGTVDSNGHNLIGSDTGCTFNSKSSDKVGENHPKLGPLADNGGPTKTLALLVGSPALDDIPKAACALKKDQRGVTRPQGPRCDIGSYEREV